MVRCRVGGQEEEGEDEEDDEKEPNNVSKTVGRCSRRLGRVGRAESINFHCLKLAKNSKNLCVACCLTFECQAYKVLVEASF